MLDDTVDISLGSLTLPAQGNAPLWSSFQRQEGLVKADVLGVYKQWPSDTRFEEKPPAPVAAPPRQQPDPSIQPRKTGTLSKNQQIIGRTKGRGRGRGSRRETPLAEPPVTTVTTIPATPMQDEVTALEPAVAETDARDPLLSVRSPFDGLLQRAETLLSRLNRVVPADSTTLHAVVGESHHRIIPADDESQDHATKKDFPSKPIIRTNEIDLLLHGLPEAYDPEPEVDDEVVRRILSEGGGPPSQIAFQSVYASHQRSLKKLSSIRYLHLHLNDVIVYSSNFGIRESVSFLTVKGPKGSVINVSNIDKIYLQERAQVMQQRKTPSVRGKAKVSDNFIVGSVPLDRTLSWELSLTDELVSDWRKDQASGSLVVELHSAILPPRKGVSSETTCFAKAVIPLYGLLSVESFSAKITCEFHVVRLVHDAVVARMKNLPSGYKISSSEVPRVGSLSGRVWLQTHDESFVRKADLSTLAPPLIIPDQIPANRTLDGDRAPAPLQHEEILSSALSYVPDLPTNKVEPSHWGIYFHSVRLDAKVPVLQHVKVLPGTTMKVTLTYKCARR